ncbi:hypothetical protein ACFL6C_07630 [Myxococcota bacterium]
MGRRVTLLLPVTALLTVTLLVTLLLPVTLLVPVTLLLPVTLLPREIHLLLAVTAGPKAITPLPKGPTVRIDLGEEEA